MIYELPNLVSEDTLSYINAEIVKNYNNSNVAVYKSGSYRDGKSINISTTPELSEVDKVLFNIFSSDFLLNFINRRYSPPFDTADSGYEFHRYAPGDVCHVHGDSEVIFPTSSQNAEVFLRFASVVLHLNTPKSGGELVFPTINRTIKTEAGKIVIFPPYNFAPHYTTPSSDNRDVVVTWFVYKDLLVRKR